MTGEGPAKPVAVQLRVHDIGYPRNARLREHLRLLGMEVRVSPRAQRGPKPLRLLADLFAMLRDTRGARVAVLSEFSLPSAPAARVIARLRGIPLIVDGFVGKHETAIEDWGYASPRSLRALLLRLVDRASVRAADLYLIDTEARAEALREHHGRRTPVIGLPVGAPRWIAPHPPRAADGTLRVLYSGGNIPLHGLPLALEAVAAADPRVRLDLVLSGPREVVQARIDALGIGDRCTIHPPVSHRELVERMEDADVVLGIFGDSPKARGVVANKVWQGLAAGRPVVTLRTPATEELLPHAGGLLTLVDDAAGLTRALDDLRARGRFPEDAQVAERLEEFVRERYRALDDWLADRVR
ncbi:glycosyltransferase [Leifsonia sp. F6_8S_P_1B]|uniref:Glycosyltransferase n=1 Tax=Leifsonia williamsii TaxID=3035919 RepID=A0ABT8KDZ8_9MICO|nr:glycosyltransferase [Leifsonia williamsii]MDN4614534.1 glycosyltransferase [Leifsonia williamsii]